MEGLFLPVMTRLPQAPEAILCVIRCNCSAGCISLKCTCRKHHLKYSAAYSQCRGSGCTNSLQPDDSESSSEDDDDSVMTYASFPTEIVFAEVSQR